MIDLMNEELVSLAAAASGLPGSRGAKRLNPATAWRWAQKGVRVGSQIVRLETVKIGARWMTSRQAVARFIARCSVVADGDSATIRTPAERREASERAVKELEAMGA